MPYMWVTSHELCSSFFFLFLGWEGGGDFFVLLIKWEMSKHPNQIYTTNIYVPIKIGHKLYFLLKYLNTLTSYILVLTNNDIKGYDK